MSNSSTLPPPIFTRENAAGGSVSTVRAPQPPPIPLELLRSLQQPSASGRDDSEQDLEETLRRAPPWLLSTVFHMAMLILLGISYYSVEKRQDVEIKIYSETIGDQLLDDAPGLATNQPELPTDDKPAFSPIDLPAVSDPLAAPALADLSLHGTFAGGESVANAPIGLALSGREKGMKKALSRIYGGNATTQDAVNRALAWCKRNQRADGAWSLKGPYADGAYDEDQPAATALMLLAFQGDGHTHQAGEYQAVVRKGWKALLRMQSPQGQFLGNGVPSQHQLYAHAQCTIALCELYGMTGDSAFRLPAERAIDFCVKAQDRELGGWRYTPGIDSDLSVTGWFLMALQSARMAKLEVPGEIFERAGRFLDSVQLHEGSSYGYVRNDRATLAMTAEGLLSRQYLGWKRDDSRLISGVESILANPIKMDNERDIYYWYYATQVLHHMEGDYWRRWNKVMRQEVPTAQVQKGKEEGSWDPETYRWGAEGGRLFITALHTYMLEVYYRHLPIYSDVGQHFSK